MYTYSTDQLQGIKGLCFTRKERTRFACVANERQTRPKHEANAFVRNTSYHGQDQLCPSPVHIHTHPNAGVPRNVFASCSNNG